ncbi:GPW/gp25 family protein [Franconibacter helveticus 513]|uniref:GPW/gp25 family protein n=1 Tax=Franconibacter helveticus TaxID=357240 RepID=UPI00128FCBAD|nr:GPW/gp25 family protein [Franconibacter helveticus]
MMRYIGMNQESGVRITDLEHLRQSIRDILVTPVGSRLARREYGSLLAALIDQPQNDALKLQVMAAVYSALCRWEPRLVLNSINIERGMDGSMTVDLTGNRNDGGPASLSVELGVMV